VNGEDRSQAVALPPETLGRALVILDQGFVQTKYDKDSSFARDRVKEEALYLHLHRIGRRPDGLRERCQIEGRDSISEGRGRRRSSVEGEADCEESEGQLSRRAV
jgi:hypothetical protein